MSEEIELSSTKRSDLVSQPTNLPFHPRRHLTHETSSIKSSSETLHLPASDVQESTASSKSRRFQNLSFLERTKRATINFGRILQGPRNVQPLPIAGPLLTFSYTLPTYEPTRSFRPDPPFRDLYASRLRRRLGPFKHGLLLFLFFAAWITGFAFLVRANSFLAETTPSIDDEVVLMTCTSTYWSANEGCGLDGSLCLSTGSVAFRCPADCASQKLYNPRAVGNLEPYYVPLVVGGGTSPSTYRADSFVCAAAVHSGVITDKGGCGILTFVANVTSFPASFANGVQSIPFPTSFPLGLEFTTCQSRHCQDLRNEILIFNILMLAILMLVLAPTELTVFWALGCLGYWHVVLISDQPNNPPVFSDAFAGFLPALFVFYYFWRTAFRFTLPSFLSNTPLEAFIFYMAGFWPGVLFNVVSERVPIDTLTEGDFGDGAGGWVAGLLIGIVLLAANQIWTMWRTGWLPFYAKWTIAGALVIVVLSQLPDLTFRLHHYVFAIMFTPAMGFATRSSAVLQSLLLGIFVNGVGKFGFDSVLQSANELRRDGALGSSIPTLYTNATDFGGLTGSAFQNASLVWNAIPADLATSWDGFSLIVDDVERYVGAGTNYSFTSLSPLLPHFFRLAYQLSGSSGDYSKAATWYPNGTWVNPLPGPS